jgi:hypothetical protein
VKAATGDAPAVTAVGETAGRADPMTWRRNSMDSVETLTRVTPAARWRFSSSKSASMASAGSITGREKK